MVTLFKPMLPTLIASIPKEEQWVYEVKYDGYRSLLYWSTDKLLLASRNLHPLENLFPEIKDYLLALQSQIAHLLPIVMDGEICILNSPNKANFEKIQLRGRLKNSLKIEQASKSSPAQFLAFDLLMLKGDDLKNKPFLHRKEQLINIQALFKNILNAKQSASLLSFIPFETEYENLWNEIKRVGGEGIIAKKKESQWIPGLRTKDWVKIKNWKTATFILTGYEKANGYFHVSILKDHQLIEMGPFLHGLNQTEKNALVEIIKKNKAAETNDIITINPRICLELEYLELYKGKLRQPRFKQFRFDMSWEDCTWEALQKNEYS